MKTSCWLAALAVSMAPLAAFATETLTPQQWQSDVAFLAQELPRRHKNLFAYLSRAEFDRQAAELQAQIPSLSEGQIRAEISKLITSIGDAHTSIWGDGRPDAFHFLPLQFSWFKDGIFVIGAAQPYRSILGGKLTRIGNVSGDEAIRLLTPYKAHDNEGCRRVNVPPMLSVAEFLYAAHVAEAPDQAIVEVQHRNGDTGSSKVLALARVDLPILEPAYAGESPLWRRNPRAAYWSALVDDGRTLYFQYNQCRDDPKTPFVQFRSQLSQLMAGEKVQRVVLDLRNNGGGSNQVLTPWLKEIRASRFNRKAKLFVLIGPHTFSSAIYYAVELRDKAQAILVGEPTCGKPNQYGDVRTMDLPNSRIKVAYSTKYFKQRSIDESCLMPDILVEQTSKDFLSGYDPVLGRVLGESQPR